MIDPGPAQDGRPKLRASVKMRYDPVRKRFVLLLPEKAVLLSETAAEILQLCDGGSTIAELIAGLERKYPSAELRADVVEFLAQAVSKRWVEWVLPA